MLKIILSLMMMFLSFIMLFLNHPLSMGFFILIQTLIICIMSGIMIKTYWFSYILFLTFLGGLLVLFIYVTSIASNEMFLLTSKNKMLLYLSISCIITIIFIMFFNNMKWMNLSNNISENNSLFLIEFFNNDNKINLNKIYNNHNFLIMLLLMIYLFIALVAVVKITNINYGPLRSSI